MSPPPSTTPEPPASPALARATERIARAFANPDGGTKRRARDAFALGPAHSAIRARYGDWAGVARDRRLDLDAAIVALERAFRAERAHHEHSRRTWGASIRPRLALMILGELRLIARWLRRHAGTQFPDSLDHPAAPIGRPVDTAAKVTPA